MLEDKIKSFLSVSYSNGSGDGSAYGYGLSNGSGSGSGSGSGYGYGSGSGSGYGYGDGSGYGDGYDDGIKEYNGRKVYRIDDTQTLIDCVHGNYAKGSILQSDLTLTPCFIAKVSNYFAHGDTLQKAVRDAEQKALEKEPIEQRIERFMKEFPDPDVKIPCRRLWEWHHILTGSCESGRNAFAKDRGIDIDKESFTVKEFVELTEYSYGAKAIMMLAKAYPIKWSFPVIF